MASDDEEYVPSDLDEEAFIAQAYGTDEEAYLAGATTAEEDDDEEAPDYFGEGADPMSLLAGMQAQEAAGGQPYELLAQRKRRSRRQRRAAAAQEGEGEEGEEEEGEEDGGEPGGDSAGPSGRAGAAGGSRRGGGGGVFGATVTDIWSDALAEQMGLQPVKNRKKKRARERWRKKAEKKGAKRRELPEAVTSKLGEANLLYATGQNQEAIGKLMEVIRLAPNLPDPYHTLGLLHEATAEVKKALDFYMIAAHLTPKDLSLWKRLAQLSTEQGLIRQAVYCYSQVLKRDKEDVDARYDRAMLYADMGESRKATEGLEQVRSMRPEHSEAPKALARLYHRAGQAGQAAQVLQTHINSYPGQTDLTHVNILAELYCDAGQWDAVLTLVQFAENELLVGDEELPIDLRVKAGAAHAYKGDVAAAVEALGAVLEEPVDTYADLYFDAAHVLMDVGQPDKALPFLTTLADHPDSSNPQVWERLTQCHRALEDPEAALNVYQTVTQQLGPDDPGYIDAVVALAELHRELGQTAEAEGVLAGLEALIRSQDMPQDHAAATEFVLRRANILYACGKNEAYLDVTVPVLSSTLRALEEEHRQAQGEGDPRLAKRLRYLNNRAALRAAVVGGASGDGVFVGYRKYDRRKQHIRELDERAAAILAAQGATSGAESEGEDEGSPGLVLRELLKEEAPFMMLLQTGQVLLAERQYQEARELLQAALDVCGKRWTDKWKKDAVRVLLFEAALGQRDFAAALASLRPVANRWPRSPLVWNGFSRYLTETGGVRAAQRMLQPLRSRHPACLPLMLLMGHCHLLNTQYSEALAEYFHAYRLSPQEPLVLLCIAAALLNRGSTKRVPDRHRAVLQAFAFLQEYSEARCNPQEAAYNLGRAAHQLGLLHLAVPYYERALQTPPPPAAAAAGPTYDVRREAAHNLALILQTSGAAPLARQLLRTHLTV
ncbi:general transcription factor 3C polypeptide 3 isoform X1 [Micractinium conductrix]|uniref:General transcription factor 3C polypeptide 3 isoform X1 n=1 Tax=Micractinium conductrix TaxID=554055 RepID=A0A2P6VM71_9CHLO|nr:general transcription factor 3C polypeptide 3 isoform X1 [Micractinium conductrix]|eukprot:PSC75147.1 general transcription factor 3C polypeptide 3 isoform X1 [Micractinium conductrix]